MSATEQGYVYILEVKDIFLPVCKIGRTTRTPEIRCDEINKSSTGDFIWSVASYVAVNNCKELELLAHKKLSPLRQKGREFFNLHADDAHKALISILNAQSEIQEVEIKEVKSVVTKTKTKTKGNFKNIDFEYSHLMQLFSSYLGVKGRPFGQLNKPFFGISDGNVGVQWNLAICPDTQDVRLGVNLEGTKKTGKWLIAPFILSKPNIENIKTRLNQPENVFIRITRDAWQGASRLDIEEKYIGNKEFPMSSMTKEQWELVLREALTCLDENKKYRGRKMNQTVTLRSDGRQVIKNISPHLNIWTALSIKGDVEDNLKNAFAELKPIYDWVCKESGAYNI